MTPHRIATALIAPTLVFRRCACGAAITVTRSCSAVRDTVRRDITIAWRLHCTAKPPTHEEGTMRVDFELSGGGTVYLLRPVTRAAHHWVEDHLPADATWFAGAVVVEHRYIGPIIFPSSPSSLPSDGLALRLGERLTPLLGRQGLRAGQAPCNPRS